MRRSRALPAARIDAENAAELPTRNTSRRPGAATHGARRDSSRSGRGRSRAVAALLALAACGSEPEAGSVVTFPGSAVGAEAEVLERQLDRFMEEHPDVRVVQRRTPDAADQRHQLYVQWLAAGADDPDILQLDVIWTPEFAAAGWLLPLDAHALELDDFFAATLAANRWAGRLYALPWFVDVGMLYWRTDLLDAAPESYGELVQAARRVQREQDLAYGLVWQGARYEGLVTVFLEYLAAFGGEIMDERGRVVVDSPAAVRALEAMRAAIDEQGIVPRAALTWHEEETRFAFQNGQALFMRNWPYAYPLMQDASRSRVAGRFAVASLPSAGQTEPGAALGGSQLAINANSDQPEAAWAVLEFLTRPEQMLERAQQLGQYPPRASLYEGAALADALPVPPARARRLIERALPRPVTPIYTELSERLQIRLHRALSGQLEPGEALAEAARELRELLDRAGLDAEAGGARAP
jgi:multiple sugar transport system substrate-binding protein